MVAKAIEIRITYEPFEQELSGVLVKAKDCVVIGVNSAHPLTRQRFTIAHEIGHFMLAHPGEMFIDQTVRQRAVVIRRDGRSSEGTDRHEIEANRFAAELLMPRWMVEKEVRKCLLGKGSPSPDQLIADLASLFRVSTQAMEL